MPRLENNGGDVLARGGHRATFKPMGGNISQEKWDAMFEPEKKEDEQTGSDSDSKTPKRARADAGKTGTSK